MNNKEKKLFKNLCSFLSDSFDEDLLVYATPSVLGQLFFNRMQAMAYGTLKTHDLLGKVNREFRNSLRDAYQQNTEKNRSFFTCVQWLNEILSSYDYAYAMLKGAYLCRYYPEGYRTSNDIDLLVFPEDVSEIGNILTDAGFRQGNIRNGIFVPATRKDIIESKMMRGETVPYIRKMGLPYMEYLEVDINFSLDYKNGESKALTDILNRRTEKSINGLSIQTLDKIDFFIHLCSHLHKEATTLPWVEMMRDMTLYKYCDIYTLLNDMSDQEMENLWTRAQKIGLQKACAFCILQTNALFDVKKENAIKSAKKTISGDPNFLHRVIDPKSKKSFLYQEKNVFDRFFCDNRKELLKEELENEKTAHAKK